MIPKLLAPDRTSDGWRLVLEEESMPVWVVAGNGATASDALHAATRELMVVLGQLAHELVPDPHRAALEEVARRAALHFAGEMSAEAVVEALATAHRIG